MASPLIGPFIQLTVGEPLIPKDNGFRLRLRFRLNFEELVNSVVPGIVYCRVIPFHQDLPAFDFRKKRQGGNAPGRVGQNALQ